MPTQCATLEVNDRLELKLRAISGIPFRELKVGLTRIMAQHLANALLEYTGARAKSFGRDKRTIVAATDLTPLPEPPRRPPVRISSRKKNAVVRL